MDLAAIRKKARASADPPSELVSSRSLPSVQGAPSHSSIPPAAQMPSPPPSTRKDPLEALFSGGAGMVFSTEESYQQGLKSQGKNEEAGLRQVLTFALGSEEYALDITDIREIIKPREITDIPRVPDFILGIISLRGIIIPVFDLKRRLKLGAAELSALTRIIVCQLGDRVIGLLVDSISQVVHLSEKHIEPPPAVLSGVDRDLVVGVGRQQGRMMILLHLPSVLDVELI